MNVLLDDQSISAARISVDEIKLELAMALYARGRITLGQAARLAGVSQWQMRQSLAARHIDASYDAAELQDDVQQVGRLA